MDFKINRGRGKCSVTGREFSDGEEYVVALKPDPDPDNEGVFHRMEISLEAWERQGRDDITAWWRAEFSTARRPLLVDADALWEIFHKARRGKDEAAADDEADVEEGFGRDELDRFAYVAALGLIRLKKLNLKSTRRHGALSYMVLETRGRKSARDTYEVVDVNLTEEESAQVQERLAELL